MKSKGKKKEAAVINKEETAENWCFCCKDGGELRICDYKDCLKCYHPFCVKKEDSFLESEEYWACAWHTCFKCGKGSHLQCYTCTNAVCRRCLPDAEIFRIKGQYGFCEDCLKLALLIEDRKDYDSDGNEVDFKNLETREGLFMEYYLIIKKEEGFESGDLYAAKDGVRTKKNTSENDEKEDSDYDETSDYDGEEHVKRCRRTGNEKILGSSKKVGSKSSKNDFVGWASRPLVDFLRSIGKSTSEKLSQHDVASIVNMYVQEKKLLDPKRRKIISCDVQLHSLFRKRTISKYRVQELLEAHFAENYDDDESEEDKVQYDSEDDNADIPDVSKRQKKLCKERKSPGKEKADNIPPGCFALIVVENVKLVYLRKSLLLELLKQPESFTEKVVGCFVRIKCNPYDYRSRISHQLMQVKGVGRVDQNSMEAFLLISAMPREISTSQLSDDDLSEEECEDLRRRILAGQLERPTVDDLQQKANILHVDITNHWINKELALLPNLIDRANEKGWRRELYEYLERKNRLQNQSEVSKLLKNVPKVIPDLHELHPNSKENDMNSEKDPRKSDLRCNSRLTNDGWQDEKESEEKTRCSASAPSARKQLFSGGPNSVPKDDSVISKKLSQPTTELENNKPEGQEPETFSQEMSHELAKRISRQASRTAASELMRDDEKATYDPESSIWCLKAPNGECHKYPFSVLKTWTENSEYAPKFKVWKENEDEENAVWLLEAFSKK